MEKPGSYKIIVSVLLSAACFMLAYLAFIYELEFFGYTFFMGVPICTGFVIGQRPTIKMNLLITLYFSLAVFFLMLIVWQLEFFFCIILSLPIVLVGSWVGTAIGYKMRKLVDKNRNNTIKLNLLPLAVILFAATVEHLFVNKYDHVKVSTSMYLPYSPQKVYDYIKSVDTLNTGKPFLMQLGLPVPEKCVLQKEDTGALRTCYFGSGTITEKVTALKRGEYLKMDVVESTVPLPYWLKFEEAIYLFEPKDNGTTITRITTYRTELKPRFYWRYLEVKSIEAEHDYVLNDLKRRLGN